MRTRPRSVVRPILAGFALLAGCLAGGCATSAPKPRLVVAANVTDPVSVDAPRTYHFEVRSARMLAVVAPERERLADLLTRHGYEEVPISRAALVVEVRVTSGIPVYSDTGPIVARSGAEAMTDEQRSRTLAAVLPNRYQDVFAEEGAQTAFVIGPSGEVMPVGERNPAPTGDLDPVARPRHFVSALELRARDIDPAGAPGTGRPRWQVVVICEAESADALVPVSVMMNVAASHIGQTTNGEKRVELSAP